MSVVRFDALLIRLHVRRGSAAASDAGQCTQPEPQCVFSLFMGNSREKVQLEFLTGELIGQHWMMVGALSVYKHKNTFHVHRSAAQFNKIKQGNNNYNKKYMFKSKVKTKYSTNVLRNCRYERNSV